MKTVICSNHLCGKEYNVKFDNCPFCGAANQMEEHDRKELIEDERNSDKNNIVEDRRQFNGFVSGIILLSIFVGGIRGVINCLTSLLSTKN